MKLRYVKKEFQKRRFISAACVCVATILSGYLYSYTGNLTVSRIIIIVFYISTGIMVWQWSWFLGRKLTIGQGMGRKAIEWISVPEWEELANTMGVKLHEALPFGIMEDFNGARATLRPRQIIIGRNLFNRLEGQERLALVAHELTHLKENHSLKQILLPVLPAILACLTIPAEPRLISIAVIIATFTAGFAIVGKRNEHAADAGAAERTSNQIMISLLKKCSPPEKWSNDSETYPSIKIRIERLARK